MSALELPPVVAVGVAGLVVGVGVLGLVVAVGVLLPVDVELPQAARRKAIKSTTVMGIERFKSSIFAISSAMKLIITIITGEVGSSKLAKLFVFFLPGKVKMSPCLLPLHPSSIFVYVFRLQQGPDSSIKK